MNKDAPPAIFFMHLIRVIPAEGKRDYKQRIFMGLQDWWHLTIEQVVQTDGLEWIAVALSVAEVLLARAGKIALYPSGIIASLLTIYLFYKAGLFAECVLNGYYVVMSVYGWWHWIKKKNLPPVKPTYSNSREWAIVVAIVLAGFGISAFLLKQYSPSTVPLWDAWVSATGWAGMWLLAKRKIENWVLLNVSNLFAIPLLLYKQMPMYAALTLFLFIVAVQGYFEWRKIIRSEHQIPGTASL